MSYSFKLSNEIDKSYENQYKLQNNINLNYSRKEYFNSYIHNNTKVICYGYCFDIRNPKQNIQDTLSYFVENDNIDNDLSFLNGHFILIIEKGTTVNLYTDASSLTPLYFSNKNSVVTNRLPDDIEGYFQLNPAYKLNLNDYQVDRISTDTKNYNHLDDNSMIDYLISLFYKQYGYFSDKKLFLPFKADNFTKSIFAILSPILYDNTILLNSSKITDKDKMFAEIFKNEFRMKLNEEVIDKTEILYLCKNNLSNFNAIYSKKYDINSTLEFLELYENENHELLNHEYNLMNLNRESNLELSQNYLIYEPLNCREILNVFIELNKRINFKIHMSIIDNLKESLKYYNFTNGKTLSVINAEHKNRLNTLIDNSMESPTQKFLLDVKTSNFAISQNLTGKIKNEEIIVYPARQKISKKTDYTINYSNSEEGLIFIESFYKNKKNARRIKVWVNDEEFNIVDLYGGRYFYFKDECNIILKYMQDYESLSWQKAGTLAVKKI